MLDNRVGGRVENIKPLFILKAANLATLPGNWSDLSYMQVEDRWEPAEMAQDFNGPQWRMNQISKRIWLMV